MKGYECIRMAHCTAAIIFLMERIRTTTYDCWVENESDRMTEGALN
jgi:hypothetical protein